MEKCGKMVEKCGKNGKGKKWGQRPFFVDNAYEGSNIEFMGRIARAVMVGHPHHITQRGNYRQDVFGEPEDYTRYLGWLKEYSEKYSLKIWAYCLMSNHVHFIAIPMWPDSLSKVFNTLHMRYSQYYNKKMGVQGHLWQGRFFSCALDEPHLYAAMRYVENNPVRAGIAPEAAAYKWSSALSHVKGHQEQLLSEDWSHNPMEDQKGIKKRSLSPFSPPIFTPCKRASGSTVIRRLSFAKGHKRLGGILMRG